MPRNKSVKDMSFCAPFLTIIFSQGRSKSYFEVFVLGVERDLFDFGFSDITSESIPDVPEEIVNIVRSALGEHLNGAVQEVANPACQRITIGYVVDGEAKANTLHAAYENYTFCGLAHFSYRVLRISYCVLGLKAIRFYINPRRFMLQAGNGEVN
jgi:hypothetical protein